ncbi:MAG: hypothetical protein GQ535_14285 [Rhodobacteraceae bacterium]|nr:hypothetical protein [Paracoccaceae bacterium]
MRIFVLVALIVFGWVSSASAICSIIHAELENPEFPRQYPLAKNIIWEIGSPSGENYFVAYGQISRTSDRPLLHESIEIQNSENYPIPESGYYEMETIPSYILNITYYSEFVFSGKVLMADGWEIFEDAPIFVDLTVGEAGAEFVPTWPFYSILRKLSSGWSYTTSNCGVRAPQTKSPDEFEELAQCIPLGDCLR